MGVETQRLAARRQIRDITVSPVALGGAGGWAFTDEPDDDYAIRAIHTALDCGITMIDTARAYTTKTHPGYSESMVARALASYPARPDVLVTTKGGHYRDGDGFPVDGKPETIRRHIELSLELLEVDQIDLYQLHCIDPEVPLRTTLGTLGELQDEGLIRYIGMNSVTVAELEEAMAVVDVATVQHWLSPLLPWTHPNGQGYQYDPELLEYCSERSIPYLAFSPLRGPEPDASLSAAFPKAAALAKEKGVSIERLTIAWLLTLSPNLIVITGASRPQTIEDSALAGELSLSDDDLARLDFGWGTRP